MEGLNFEKRLLLINPWQTYEKHLESEYQSYIPYGLACIGAIGIEQGYNTKIVDCLEDETRIEMGNFIRFGKKSDEIEDIITKFKPNIVGISSTFSMFERDATSIAEIVKKIDPTIVVILGGVTATLSEVYEPLLLKTTVYDIMSRGEGEDTFRDLLKNYNQNTRKIENLYAIPGIAYKENGSVVCTSDRELIRDLDSLPFPALELLNMQKVLNNKYFSRWRNNPINKKSIPVFTSRGCPYNCCFCSVHSQVGYKHRTYSINYVIELMKLCIDKFGIDHFHFEDDNLTFDVERAKQLFREMAKLNITWDTPNGVRADRLDEEMVQLMQASGIISISIAAESGSDEVRKNIIHKNLSTDSILNAIKICDRYDLPCIVFFVLGFPGETMDNIRETISFAKMIAEHYNTINMIFIANPLPGTELSKTAKEKGYFVKKMTNSDYFVAIRANQASILETEQFTKKRIFELLREELDVSGFSVHNITQPMFWADTEIAWRRAKRAFPKTSNRKVTWEWKGE